MAIYHTRWLVLERDSAPDDKDRLNSDLIWLGFPFLGMTSYVGPRQPRGVLIANLPKRLRGYIQAVLRKRVGSNPTVCNLFAIRHGRRPNLFSLHDFANPFLCPWRRMQFFACANSSIQLKRYCEYGKGERSMGVSR